MSVLGELQPNKVFKYFEEICSIPHGSRNLQQISDYLVDFAKAHELKYRQDEDLNVIIWKDGSKGYEASEPVILQGHMDMVAVKEADCDKNMEKEGLDLEINGDYISAKGTSLGGDDGIAVAYTLAVLDDEEMAHPPIEAIFTVNEEIGMLGAATIDVSDLKGRLFMNMDSEDEGVFTVSCAGGASVICKIPYETETVNASVIEIKMTGFAGGHSGVEIIKGRLNANCAMARVLLSLFNEVEMQLVSVNGGEKDNAIAKFSEASVAVLPEELEAAKQIVEDTFAQIKEEYKVTDPDAKLTVNVKEAANIVVTGISSSFVIMAQTMEPDNFKKIILVNPSDINIIKEMPTKETKAAKTILEIPILGTFIYNLIMHHKRIRNYIESKYFFKKTFLSSKLEDTYFESAHKGNSAGKYLLASTKGNYVNIDITNAVKKTDNLYIISSRERNNAVAITEKYLHLNKNIEATYISNSRYLPQLETPDKFKDIVLMFLQ